MFFDIFNTKIDNTKIDNTKIDNTKIENIYFKKPNYIIYNSL